MGEGVLWNTNNILIAWPLRCMGLSRTVYVGGWESSRPNEKMRDVWAKLYTETRKDSSSIWQDFQIDRSVYSFHDVSPHHIPVTCSPGLTQHNQCSVPTSHKIALLLWLLSVQSQDQDSYIECEMLTITSTQNDPNYKYTISFGYEISITKT